MAYPIIGKFGEALKRLTRRQDAQDEEIIALRRRLEETEVQLGKFGAWFGEVGQELSALRHIVDGIDEQLQAEFERLAKAAKKLKQQTRDELLRMRHQIESLVSVLEASLAKQAEPAQRQRIKSLIKSASARKRRVERELEGRPLQ